MGCTLVMARSILIVDDHRPLAEMVAFLLRSEGYAVHLSHDGQAALDEAERNRPGTSSSAT
jgi:DNA-binding response OmpR family regulator